MPRISTSAGIAKFIVLFSLFFCSGVLAGDELLPSIEEIQQRLKTSSDAADISEQEKSAIEQSYQQAIDNIRATEQFDEQTNKYNHAIKDAPKKLNRLENDYAKFQYPPVSNKSVSQSELLARVTDTEGDVTSTRARLSELKATLDDERRLLLRQIISETQTAIDATNNNLTTDEDSNPAKLAQSIAQAAERKMLQAKIGSLKERLAYRPAHLAIIDAQVALEQKKLQASVELLNALRSLQNN